jgi:hypothetical protein
MEEIRDHAIIKNPWEYRIVQFNYNSYSPDHSEHYIDIWLQKDRELRKLRFLFPRQLKIEEGFPRPTMGMEILDVSHRQMENINVQVSDFENSNGAVTFYAKSVEEIR